MSGVRGTVHFAACDMYERAIQQYKKIGGMKEKVDGLQKKLSEFQKTKFLSLQRFSSPEINISELIEKSKVHVQRQDFLESTFYLAHISAPLNFSKMRENARNLMQEFPFQHLFKKQIINKSGKIVAVVPGTATDSADEKELAIWGRIVEDSRIYHTTQAQGLILPAIREISLRFEPSLSDLMRVFASHPFMDDDRAYLIAKGIQHGFYYQWPEALHLLVPQLEHSVRYVLEQRGVVVTKFDEDGVQEAQLLPALLSKQEAKDAFGEDLILDFTILLVDKFGPNFRNLLAHGMLETSNFFSTQAVYLWWLILKYFFLPMELTSRKNNVAPEG